MKIIGTSSNELGNVAWETNEIIPECNFTLAHVNHIQPWLKAVKKHLIVPKMVEDKKMKPPTSQQKSD